MRERELIDIIAAATTGAGKGILQGIGDDCAVIEKGAGRVWLLTMDALVESVHFDPGWHPPELLGRKAVSVNVSDVAAMGGEPGFLLLSLALPPGLDDTWISGFVAGFTSACEEYGCLLVGGDTVASPAGISLSITAVGEAAADRVVYRSGARPGDTVWVSGPLGLAAAGLDLLKAGLGREEASLRPLLDAHLDPRARTGLGRILAQSGLVHAMMDLSDGLATDLAHICRQSGVGARVRADRLPGHPALARAASLLSRDPLRWMIAGGEDFELLFTTAAGDAEALERLAAASGHRVHAVGMIGQEEGVVLEIPGTGGAGGREEDIAFRGYEHL